MRICVTGKRNSGKSTFLNFMKNYNWEIYKADDFIHKIYKKNEIGYEFILNTFGQKYVTSTEVNRVELNRLVVSDNEALKKLTNFTSKEIFKWIKSIDGDRLIFELAIYLNNELFFKELFDKVILIKRNNNAINKNHISKLLVTPKNFSPDYILENYSTLKEFNEKINIFCNSLKNY
ncbi:MAG: dephospho-CoA kinase [Mycoplasmoidaceae bacterium]